MPDELKGMMEYAEKMKRAASNMASVETRKRLLKNSAKKVRDEARKLADKGGPVFPGATGRLKDNIVFGDSDQEKDSVIVGWTNDGYYGRLHERGFIHVGGNFVKFPHIRPAYEKVQPLDNMKKELEELL